MRILHIITGLKTGGAQRMLVKLVRATKDEIQHAVLSLTDTGTQGENLKELGIKVFTLGMTSSVPSPKVILKLRKVVKQNSPDAIQGWMYHGNLTASLGSKWISQIPVLYNVRHSLHDIKYEKRVTQWVIKLNSFFSSSTNGIIYNSRTSKKQHEEFGFSSMSSMTIPNGFNTEKYQINEEYRFEIRQELGINNDVVVFGQVGRNHPMKDHVNFLKAAAKVTVHQKNCHFLLVGRGIDADHEISKLINKLGIERYVTVFGERTDIYKIWNAVDFGVLSSAWGEGFPNVVAEAMACGNPCIVTEVGDAPYIVGNTGKIVPPRNSDALAESMLDMFALDTVGRKDIGAKARQRITDNFSIEQISDQYIKLYKEILKMR